MDAVQVYDAGSLFSPEVLGIGEKSPEAFTVTAPAASTAAEEEEEVDDMVIE